jgi:hypothetical protein
MNDMKTPDENNEIAAFEKKLAPFLSQNPYSKIEKRGKSYYVTSAWNVESVSFVLEPDSESDLINALNNLILPPRFTAVYHSDTNTMEYIYTLLDRNSPYLSRQFEFSIEGKTYHCAFKDASDRLLLLGKLFRPTGEIEDYRNLAQLSMYTNPDILKTLGLEDDFLRDSKPVSFFVSEFEVFDEEKIVEISKHINFFMRYYDRQTPYIIIHPLQRSEIEPVKQLQFVEPAFPKHISTRRQDPFLLDLALAANQATTRLGFLYYYQILEYAAFYYIDDDIRRKMLQIIQIPDIHAYPDKYIPRILDMVSDIRQSDEAKLNKVVEIRCSPDIVWKELEQNLHYFSKRQEFDGGFAIEPFISEDMTLESFSMIWIPKTPDTLRKIRNALVHARESRLGLIIAPTSDNDIKLRPWLSIIRRIAEQALIFG